MGCLSLLPFGHPAIYVLAPVDDAAAEAEAVWPDAEVPPVPQRGHRRARNGRRRPILRGRAAPLRRSTAAGTLGRLWSGPVAPQDTHPHDHSSATSFSDHCRQPKAADQFDNYR